MVKWKHESKWLQMKKIYTEKTKFSKFHRIHHFDNTFHIKRATPPRHRRMSCSSTGRCVSFDVNWCQRGESIFSIDSFDINREYARLSYHIEMLLSCCCCCCCFGLNGAKQSRAELSWADFLDLVQTLIHMSIARFMFDGKSIRMKLLILIIWAESIQF